MIIGGDVKLGKSICTKDTNGERVSSTTDKVRDVVIYTYNPSQDNVSVANQVSYTSYVSG